MEEDSPFSKICRCMESALDTEQEDDLVTLLPGECEHSGEVDAMSGNGFCVNTVVRTLFVLLGRRQADSLHRMLTRMGALYEACDSEMTHQNSNEVPIFERSDLSVRDRFSPRTRSERLSLRLRRSLLS